MILLTGAPGWLGNRMLEMLSGRMRLSHPPETMPEGPVRCLVEPGANPSILASLMPEAEVVTGDLTRPESLQPFVRGAEGATLLHFAGTIHPTKGVRQFYDVNVRGTWNLMRAAATAGVKKVVVLSSNSPCGYTKDPVVCFTEDSPYNPYMHYGRSKMLMEQAVQTASHESGFDVTILRGCWFYGPHQPARQSAFFRFIKYGRFPLIGGGRNMRSISYVDDLCQAALRAATRFGARGQIYWVASERPYAMSEIVEAVRDALSSALGIHVPPPRFAPPSVVSDLARFADLTIQSTGLYHQATHVLSEMNQNIVCSIARAKEELGFIPEVDLKEGMERSVRWCMKHGARI